MSFNLPAPTMPVLPQAPNPPPMFNSQGQQIKPQAKPSQPTFLGAQLSPGAGQTGGKTLLGQ